MTSPRDRRFGLADAMILVAAIGVGLALARMMERLTFAYYEVVYYSPFSTVVRDDPSTRGLFERLVFRSFVLLPAFATSFTWAMLAIRLRAPRPPLRRLARQPGAVACAVATMATAIVAMHCLILTLLNQKYSNYQMNFVPLALDVGWAVSGAWATLLLAGRWRPEPSWIDRGGRCLGLVWILMVVLFYVAVYAEVL
ncbi:MAG TPA: hypothetical protein VG406_05380 [Isosphaeraceae bacterium]|jgi:hypothetical protein|nr:hypothetical protein [Isosphaeraceae bacterium]